MVDYKGIPIRLSAEVTDQKEQNDILITLKDKAVTGEYSIQQSYHCPDMMEK